MGTKFIATALFFLYMLPMHEKKRAVASLLRISGL